MLTLCLAIGGAVGACISVGLILGIEKSKIGETFASILALVAGGAIGYLAAIHSVSYWQEVPLRIPNTVSVKVDGKTITFPPPTEQGVQWCLASSLHQRPIRVVDTYTMADSEKDFMVHLAYPDGTTSQSVPVAQ